VGRRRLSRPVLGVVAALILVGGAAAADHYFSGRGTQQLLLDAKQARVTRCVVNGPRLETTVDLANPVAHTADLSADVEFDDATRYPTLVGVVWRDAVPSHQVVKVSGAGPTDESIDDLTYRPGRVTCKIVLPDVTHSGAS
jgi:hypothetical protein